MKLCNMENVAKYINYSSTNDESYPSLILWVILEVIQKRLGSSKVKNIHFEHGAINKPIVRT